MRQPLSSKWPLVITWLITVPFATVAALVGALWIWTGTDSSLPVLLSQITRYLPAEQSLTTEGARGSLRQGGRIESLRWQSPGIAIEVQQLELAWQPLSLLKGLVQLDTLHIGQLRIESRQKTTAPPVEHTPWTSLTLPVALDATFAVDSIRWVGPPLLDVQSLSGKYRYDHQQHLMDITGVKVASGTYSARATLLAHAPLLLDLALQGDVETLVPGGTQAIALHANATVKGNLAGPEGFLEALANVSPSEVGTSGNTLDAQVSARVKPWALQPLESADATFHQLDLAALWPQAPQTRLTGAVRVAPAGKPDGGAWKGSGSITNGLVGPIDKGRIPVERLDAQVIHDQGRWLIESLNSRVAGGRVRVQGQLPNGAEAVSVTSGWQGSAQLENINPNAVHSQMAAAALDGQLAAKAAAQGIEFEGKLMPSARQVTGSALKGLRLKSASAVGRWSTNLLTLDRLEVKTDDATLRSQLALQTDTKAVSGQVRLNLPGGEANAKGQLAAAQGSGDIMLSIVDASLVTRWLSSLPGAPQILGKTSVKGSATLSGTWTGGYERTARDMKVEATLQVPQLEVRNKADTPEQALKLRDVSAEVSGRLAALALKLRGAAQQASYALELQTQLRGGLNPDGSWATTVAPTSLKAQDSRRPGLWAIQTNAPFNTRWAPAATGGILSVDAGSAKLSSPAPGAAALDWQPVFWKKVGTKTELTTRGQLRGLPMAWLELAGAGLSETGVTGDLLFDADWDIAMTNKLVLKAALTRRQGDIQVRTDLSTTAPTVNAGIKDARLSVTAEGDVLRAALRWDSERAGNAQVDVQTRFGTGPDGWSWPSDAPLTGTARANLPQVGAWSVLAPPGWRIRGTLEANLQLAGNRTTPHWSGTLNADDLALRSFADGIEFTNGRLRTVLKGQRLDITEFKVQGAGGATGSATPGGELIAKGFAVWQPDAVGKSSALSNIHLELEATANALRLSSRADRRLAMSGKLQAKLDEGKLNVGGDLKVDQALFILPDENTPSLGADVVIRPTSGTPAGQAKSTTQPVSNTNKPADTAGQRVVPEVNVKLDLGPDFRVEGRGLTTRLSGALTLRSGAATGSAPRVTGEVRTIRGTYKAYGQKLDIEEGVLRFIGPYDNPALDILAIRPNLTVKVGVQITGTVLAPRVRLYADPDMPEGDKLAWLVLGRSGANGGAESAMLQQAALALLGGNGKGLSGGLAASLGLDELSVGGSASSASDGTAGGATITLGKRISRDFYVAYERTLVGTLGTFSIFYDLSRRFTLRATTGEQSAIDLIFTVPYD